ncbi:restriction endonuclease subunit S [Staphylococcus chromogenes]|uniref:restriction endonuclease subunit S n=4 Tax=Staphylococcus chromogenes TaxID=46126 RepID=UPI000D199A04|nr:restriction endonuclease subunit S [Staphylococcus chromogenes]PTF40483.1 restriction endonuclease subunit S [Staphylococcus chromogenes]PTF85166.1 restriction endonuclease subunit S [Staphylococcus chromogenes]PTG01761.1 restriction endonuclease subunit S [Staphylococcus chromogenes]PTG05238.1 restriction endonuclease subunit S [Staphylococcus chromogenes]PTG74739.1 restriction endonuclease subunit S [Staphylococcus chromogenes]
MEFKEYKLADITKKIYSGGTPSTRETSYWNGDLKWLSSGETSNRFIISTEKTITQKGVENSSTKLAFKHDLVMASAGQGYTRGQTSFLKIDTYINQSLIAISVNKDKIHPLYLFYNLVNRYDELRQISDSSSTRGSINTKMIKNLNILIPEKSHQNRIVYLINSIDEKIEINKKIIANLEELSKTLFKRWFVDFEFPDENGNPYKSSGGEMVDSELGKIPKGWECVYLKDIVHHKKDTFNPKKSNESEVKHFSLPAFDSGQYPTIDNVTDIKSNKWIIDENCILFSKMNPTTRRIWVTSYNENFLNVASSEFVVLKSDNSYRNAFIYNICISDKFNEYLVSNTTGSTNSRQRVKPDIAVQYRFAYNEEVSYLLSEKIEPYIEKIKIIREQNQNLTQIRDTLLPKLMSGEIEIPDDIEVNEDELSI